MNYFKLNKAIWKSSQSINNYEHQHQHKSHHVHMEFLSFIWSYG